MTKIKFIIMLCVVAVFPVVAEENEVRNIPPAFPEGRRTPQQADAPASAPFSTVLPGAPDAGPSALAAPVPPENADWLLRRMAESADPSLRKRASEAWPVSDSFMDDMDMLVYALVDPSEGVRAGAVGRLERLEPAQVFGYVMRTMAGGSLDRVRALNNALPAFKSMLTPFMMETLRTELETPLHRRIAAYCLGRMGAPTAIDLLGEYAWNDDYTLSRACVEALYAIGTSQTAPHWMNLLDHHDPYCRQLAARALTVVGGANAFDRLRYIVLDNNEDLSLQSELLYALSVDPSPRLYTLLVEVIEYNQPLRPVALRLLRAVAGVDFGWDMAAWRSWLNGVTAPPPSPPIVPGR